MSDSKSSDPFVINLKSTGLDSPQNESKNTEHGRPFLGVKTPNSFAAKKWQFTSFSALQLTLRAQFLTESHLSEILRGEYVMFSC